MKNEKQYLIQSLTDVVWIFFKDQSANMKI